MPKFLAALLALILATVGAPSSGHAQTYMAGKEYVVLDQPAPTADPATIEVVEVFSFGCPHCFQLEPLLEAWKQRQSADVRLVRVPTFWSPNNEPLVRGYYTLRALGIDERAMMPVFNAIHVDHRGFYGEADWSGFLAGQGVAADKVLAAYSSDAVTKAVLAAPALTGTYGATGTPELIVDGRYRTSPASAGGYEQMLKVVDYLVAKRRAERGK